MLNFLVFKVESREQIYSWFRMKLQLKNIKTSVFELKFKA